MRKWTRRAFITAGTLVGGGLVLGVGGIALAPNRLGVAPKSAGSHHNLTTWLKITSGGDVIAIVPHCEMGQGAQTGLAMMLAEELDAEWSRVRIEEAPALSAYANGHFMSGMVREFQDVPSWLDRALEYTAYRVSRLVPLQVTGGSASTMTTGQYGMRVAGAAAREMLIEAAATQWEVGIEACDTRAGRVWHHATQRVASYGELAEAAAQLKPPVHPRLKPREEYNLVGTSQPRPDIPGKVSGVAQYGVDVQLPGMLYATIAAAPIPGANLISVDPQPALETAGVSEVIELADAVAVVGTGYWPALQGLRALEPNFGDAGKGDVNTETFYAEHGRILDSASGNVDFSKGDGKDSLVNAATHVDVEYLVPYLAHATMEPMAATAQISEGRCEVWAGTQDPLNARNAAADAAEMDEEDVTFHNLHSGGGFGRRLPFSFDYIDQAVRIARRVSPAPVKLIWSREEDMRHDYYRPAMMARFRGGLDGEGHALSWVCTYTGPGEFGAARPAYDVPHQEIITNETPQHLRHGSWRSVGFSQQGFFMESFVDEMAVAAGRDPYEFRRELLAEKPYHRDVLDRAASLARWDRTLPEGRGLGIAMVESFGTIVAEVAEVSVDLSGKIRVHAVWAAVDCGLVVNPDQALAQVEGGILFGLSAALFQEITLRDGAVAQSSFPDYPSLKIGEAPRVSVAFMDSDKSMGGLGEPSVPPIAPAVANAVFAASGKRFRKLPLQPA